MIEKAFIISLFVFAINYTMKHGEIFGFIGDWLDEWLPEKIKDPVFNCVVCQAPWYGTILYWSIWGIAWKECLIVIIAAMGLNVVINQTLHKDE